MRLECMVPGGRCRSPPAVCSIVQELISREVVAMKFLVLGATGTVGSNVVRELQTPTELVAE